MLDRENHEQRVAFANAVAEDMDADVLIFSGTLMPSAADRVMELCASRKRRANVFLLISTYGGLADAAYKIARCLQRSYSKVTLVVDGFCKSAGTLLALGCDELVLSEWGELGPLDVQVLKGDEWGERQSGTTPTRAMISLRAVSYQAFEENFKEIRRNLLLTTKLAAEIASNMTVGVFKEIYGQIDPMRVGEIDRAMSIADAYGQRLSQGRGNVKADALPRLLAAYPSHGFVIDCEEARTLFNSVRRPTDKEEQLLALLRDSLREPDDQPTIDFLSSEAIETAARSAHEEGAPHVQPDAGGDRPHPPGAEPAGDGADRPDGQLAAPTRVARTGGNGKAADTRGPQ